MRMPIALLCCFASPVLAASPEHGNHGAHTPYAGLQAREIKALSEKELADLRAGRSMGLALAAELNGYPGPRHVLDLADKLALKADQRRTIETLMSEMLAQSKEAGGRLIVAETALDRLFAQGKADTDSLKRAMLTLAHAQMELRYAHLSFHLSTKAALTGEQIAVYNRLRGYTPSAP